MSVRQSLSYLVRWVVGIVASAARRRREAPGTCGFRVPPIRAVPGGYPQSAAGHGYCGPCMKFHAVATLLLVAENVGKLTKAG